jgi:cobalt-zinc-cadmium efflux system membrane fusion protein
MTARRTLLALTTGSAIAAAGFLAGRTFAPPTPEAAATPEAPPPLPSEVELSPEAVRNFGLRTASAERRPLLRTVRVTGSVGFNELRLAHINPLARGRMQAIEVTIGERVRTGQRLAILDALDLAEARHQLASAEASLRQAEAERMTVGASLQRALDLVRSGSLAQSEVDRRRAEAARVEASVQTKTVEVEHWREMLSRYSPAVGPAGRGPDVVSLTGSTPEDSRGAMLAPFAGAILSIGATPGELVDTNREIFTLADLTTMWVQADVPERDLAAVQAGAEVAIAVDAYPGRRFPGKVAYVADQLDGRTGTAKVRCEVANPDSALKANMFATVEIAAPMGRDGLVVPDAAVQMVDGQPVVFVPSGPNAFRRRDVRTGPTQRGSTEIAEGLEPCETVVAEGSVRLKALLLHSRTPTED